MAKLGEVCKVSPSTKNIERQGAWLLNLDMVEQQTGRVIEYKYVGEDDLNGSIIQFDTENVLYSKLRPNLNKVVLPPKDGFSTSELLPLRPDACVLNRDYLAVFLRSDSFVTWAVSKTAGAKMPRLGTKDLMNAEIPVPTIEQQKKIAEKFKKLEQLISLRNQQLAKLDELVKAQFVEMFGDVLLNSMQWPEKTLENMANIVSGITKGRKTAEADLQEVPYMAVSNVKDGYIDWTTVKTILATRQEIEQYRLMPDDILMTEGGDPDKVGRGAIIKVPLKNSIHQNHIFRVRLDEQEILPSFFAEYLRHQKAKRYFLGCAKQTTGIASINMRQLRALPTLVPPLSLQKQFAAFVERVDQQKQIVQQSLEKLELMKKTLMQEYFG